MTISICMIVKNEEECLTRALASWRDLGDELIIVDTGSTDNTVAIAEAHGARVLTYDWQLPGHKGEARNVGLDAAIGDWILVLDADEVIIDPGQLRHILLNVPSEPAISGVNTLFRNMAEDDSVLLEWYQMRVFRRGMYRYVHREHEIPTATDHCHGIISSCKIVFEHRAPAGRDVGKISPMLERLRLDVEERPNDSHSLYMYARQLAHNGQYDEAIKRGEQYMQMPRAGLKPDVARATAICYMRMNNRPLMYEWMYRAASYEPHRRLIWAELALLYRADGNMQMALAMARLALSLPLIPYQREMQPAERTANIAQFIDECQQA